MKHKMCVSHFLKIAVRPTYEEYEHWKFQINENKTRYIWDASLLSLLSKKLALKYDILLPKTGNSGELQPDGKWNGIIGMVLRGEADIGMGHIAMSKNKTNAVDFSYPYDHEEISFITHKPIYVHDRYALLHPFSPTVWIAILISFLILQIILYFLKTQSYSFQSIVLKTFSILLGVSTNLQFRELGLNFLTLSWILGTFFLIHAYRAVLLSSLTLPSLSGIQTIRQLAKAVEDSSFKCSTYGVISAFSEMLDSGGEEWQKIGRCLKRSNMYTFEPEKFMRAMPYRSAFIGPNTFLKAFQTEFFLSDDVFSSLLLGIAIGESFPCRRELNDIIKRLVETEIVNKIRSDDIFFFSHIKRDLKTQEYNDPKRKLNLEDFAGAFVILLFGYFLALFVFIIEVFYHKTFSKVTRKNVFVKRGDKVRIIVRNKKFSQEIEKKCTRPIPVCRYVN